MKLKSLATIGLSLLLTSSLYAKPFFKKKTPKPEVKLAPIEQRVDSLRTNNTLSDKEEFLLEFAFPDSNVQTGKSLSELMNGYFPENTFFIQSNDELVNGKIPNRHHKAKNQSGAFHIGNRLLMTSEHCIDGVLLDSVWTGTKPVEIGSILGINFNTMNDEQKEIINKTYSLKHYVTGEVYAFRVLAKDPKLDVAILEIDSSFTPKGLKQPAIYLESNVTPRDTAVHFMNGIYAHKFTGIRSVNNPDTTYAIDFNGNEVFWSVNIGRIGRNPLGKIIHIESQGLFYEYNKENVRSLGCYYQSIPEKTSARRQLSSIVSINGNSGLPMFKKEDGLYFLTSTTSSGTVSKTNRISLLGEDFPRATEVDAKPSAIQEFIYKFIQERYQIKN